MKKIIELIVDDEVFEYFNDNNKYFEKKENEYIPISKLHLAFNLGTMWSESTNHIEVEEENGLFEASYIVPIYDWIVLILKAFNTNKDLAIKEVKELYNDLYNYNEIYEKNVERNKRNFMSRIKKFAYFNDEIHYFEDSSKDFRELVVECGIPNDARADEPIFGYLDGNNLVIYKEFFMKGEKEFFFNFVNEKNKEIAKYFGLKEYNLYLGKRRHEEIFVDENDNLLEELLTMDFDYYTPIKFVEKIKLD